MKKDIIKLYFDGAAEPNPGHGGYGFLVKRDNETIYSFGMSLGNPTTNNQAEHLGLLHGLTWLFQNGYTNSELVVYGDSTLVLNQVFGKWNCKAEHLKFLVQMNKELKKQFRYITSDWVASENNPADYLSRMFL
jgi:ribonuclease HI